MEKIQEEKMKNIEDINKLHVKKILAKKKYPSFLLAIQLRLGLELQKEKEKEFNILKAYVLQKKIGI